jgi:hypothetical protein
MRQGLVSNPETSIPLAQRAPIEWLAVNPRSPLRQLLMTASSQGGERES